MVSTSAAIAAKLITVTAATDTKPYDGNASFTGVPTITAGTFITTVDATGVNLVFTTSYVAPQPIAAMSIGPVTGSSCSINYSGGTGSRFVLVRSTNVAAPLNTWPRVATNSAASGSFTISIGLDPKAFYRIISE